MKRWLLVGIAVAALVFSVWQWGGRAALPFLGLLPCLLMCGLMGGMMARGSGHNEKPPADGDRNTQG